MRKVLALFWSDWRLGFAMALAVIAALALLSAWLTPRGPITAAQALTAIGIALVAGLLAGLLLGSRWAMLLAPVAFVLVFELGRMRTSGPTVDQIYLGSMYGMIAFVLGRLMHWVLIAPPMLLGAAWGAWLARGLGNATAPAPRTGSWIVTGVVAVGVVALAVVIARPGRTAPIIGADGAPLPGSIAELTTTTLGGHEQALMIRGRSVENPVLLYLAGGPGGTDLGAMRADVGLEQDFVVVTWEQRGAGKSYQALDPIETLTLDQMVADTIALTNYLRERFDEDKIYLVGNSWGTILGALAVQQQPELYHAFVGAGQMVSPRETDIMFYEDTLAWADTMSSGDLAATLRANGPPPYDDLLKYEPSNSHEHDWNPYPEFDSSREMPAILFVPENSLMDRINGLRSFLDTFAVLYPQIQDVDFGQDVTQLDAPVYIVLGAHEARGRATLVRPWFEALQAPSKELVIFEHSGHRPLFEEPGRFAELMRRVLAETQ